MATLTIQDTTSNGVAPSYAAIAATDQFQNTGHTYIHIKTGAAGNTNVTIGSQVACDQGTTHNTTVVLAVNSEKMVGPFPTNRFNDASGYVQIASSNITNVTIGVFEL